MALPPPAAKKIVPQRPRLRLPAVLAALCICTVLLVAALRPASPPTATRAAQAPPEGMGQCGHIVLFSAPRHGSTWMIDSAEQCFYSRTAAESGTFSKRANAESELWNEPQQGPVRYIGGKEAAEYVQANRSIKVFPVALINKEEELMKLMRRAAELRLPVVLLRRRLEHSFGSLLVAQEKGVWNSNHGGGGEEDKAAERERLLEGNPAFRGYVSRVDGFFNRSKEMLAEAGVENVDEVDYEEATRLKYVVAERNGCYIENCNFVEES